MEEVRPYRPGKSVSRAPPGFSLEAATVPPYLFGIYIKTDRLQNSLKCSGLHDAASAVCMSFSNQVTPSLWGDPASRCQSRHPRTRHYSSISEHANLRLFGFSNNILIFQKVAGFPRKYKRPRLIGTRLKVNSEGICTVQILIEM